MNGNGNTQGTSGGKGTQRQSGGTSTRRAPQLPPVVTSMRPIRYTGSRPITPALSSVALDAMNDNADQAYQQSGQG